MEDQTLLDAMDEIEDDLVLTEAADLIERQLAYGEPRGGGGPLLDFNVRPVGTRGNWKKTPPSDLITCYILPCNLMPILTLSSRPHLL